VNGRTSGDNTLLEQRKFGQRFDAAEGGGRHFDQPFQGPGVEPRYCAAVDERRELAERIAEEVT
jgi:hypothetical protein